MKNAARIALLGAIIALTGCAARRYDTRISPVPSAIPGPGWPAQSFARPLDGRTVRPFGSPDRGARLKGVVIEGREGEPVKAALDGRVAYVDDAMPGYGRTVILEHAGGMETVYARLSDIRVKTGEVVPKGTAIASVGRTGKDSVPCLYFEVRRGARADDPSRFLPR